MEIDHDLERFIFQKFAEVMKKGQADPTDYYPLAWLYRDDRWHGNKPNKPALAWCVGIDMQDEDATPLNSARDLAHELCPQLWMQGCILISSDKR
ncbi:MAG: hypothetical protein P1U36_10410 [Legionellaceae bacterium]|nr:hypothetical protein [Legionellaceae bacterium]